LPVPRSRGALDLLAEGDHRAAVAHELPEPCLRAEGLRLGLGAHEAERVLDDEQEAIGRDRLLEEVERAEARRADRGVDRRVPAHHDDRQIGAPLPEALEERDPVAVRQRDVEQGDVVALSRELLLGHLHPAGDVDRVALERQGLLQRRQDGALVVDDDDVTSGHVGPLPTTAAGPGERGRRLL
jgi:hypothetical protein